MVERPDSEVVGSYDVMVGENPSGDKVAMLTNKSSTFVGQTAPYA